MMFAGAGELEAQRSTDAWSIKAHSETMARQQELVAHYTAVSQPALPEVCSSTPHAEGNMIRLACTRGGDCSAGPPDSSCHPCFQTGQSFSGRVIESELCNSRIF